MMLAAFGFALMGLLIKISATSFGIPQQLLIRSVVVLAISITAVRILRIGLEFGPWRLHVARGVFGFSAMALLFFCLGVLPLSVAMALNYTAPFFTLVLAWIFLGEPRSLGQLIAVIVGFFGILLVLSPVMRPDMLVPTCLGLLSGLLLGVTNITLRMLGNSLAPVWQTLLFFSLFSSCISGAWSLLQGKWSKEPSDYMVLVGVGLAATLGQYALTRAYRDGAPVIVATLSYFTLVFTSLFGALILDEMMGINTLLGMATAIIAGALVARATVKRRPLASG